MTGEQIELIKLLKMNSRDISELREYHLGSVRRGIELENQIEALEKRIEQLEKKSHDPVVLPIGALCRKAKDRATVDDWQLISYGADHFQ